MKIVTILGTRPEIIRLSLIIPLLDENSDHVLVHTGQNYDPKLSDLFFRDLKLRKPDHYLNTESKTAMGQIGKILVGCERILKKEKPDRLLLLGDTNSALSAIVAKRMRIPVYHMEAGNRCFDDRVPEEVNRRIIDHCSDVLMPYTEKSKSNLLREGMPSNRIVVTGNPIYQVLKHYDDKIEKSRVLTKFNLRKNGYFLATLHRAENVDDAERLANFVEAFNKLRAEYSLPVIWSVHPRTRARLHSKSYRIDDGIRLSEPFGLFDFVKLEKNAKCVLTDSGTVQEECCIFKVPSVTLRDTTERPETVEVGSNILSGSKPDHILRCVKAMLSNQKGWQPPAEYLVEDVASIVKNTLLGFRNHHYP